MECLPLASSQGVSRRIEEKYNTGDKDPYMGVLNQKSICGKAMRTSKEERRREATLDLPIMLEAMPAAVTITALIH